MDLDNYFIQWSWSRVFSRLAPEWKLISVCRYVKPHFNTGPQRLCYHQFVVFLAIFVAIVSLGTMGRDLRGPQWSLCSYSSLRESWGWEEGQHRRDWVPCGIESVPESLSRRVCLSTKGHQGDKPRHSSAQSHKERQLKCPGENWKARIRRQNFSTQQTQSPSSTSQEHCQAWQGWWWWCRELLQAGSL